MQYTAIRMHVHARVLLIKLILLHVHVHVHVCCIQQYTYFIPSMVQAAGYTLSELLPLCRSTVLQQRVLALNTLARITQRARQREYAGVIEGSVVSKLLEAGVPLLLRYALDDSNDAVFYVAIHALHSLLVLMPEEVSKFNNTWLLVLQICVRVVECIAHCIPL